MNPLAEYLTGRTRAGTLGRDVREVFHIVEERTRQNVPISVIEGQPA